MPRTHLPDVTRPDGQSLPVSPDADGTDLPVSPDTDRTGLPAGRRDDQPLPAPREDGAETGDDDGFPRPPVPFRDGAGRDIVVERYDGGVDALDAMYATFDAASMAQGLPPRDETRRRGWLDTLLADGVDVVARHAGTVVGHATLVPMEGNRAELAVFVDPDYQRAGIGSKLVRALLGAGQADGLDAVWLTVQRDNRIAVSLYESVGFETTGGRLELEMELPL